QRHRDDLCAARADRALHDRRRGVQRAADQEAGGEGFVVEGQHECLRKLRSAPAPGVRGGGWGGGGSPWSTARGDSPSPGATRRPLPARGRGIAYGFETPIALDGKRDS